MVNWDGYEMFDPGPGVDRPLHELDRREARRAFEKLMREKDQRIAMLKRLLSSNGIELDDSDESVQQLEDWYSAVVERDSEQPERLKVEYYGMAVDIGLYLGELIINRTGNLRWEFHTRGKRELGYHSAVIGGFTGAKNPNFYIFVQGLVSSHGHRAVKGVAGRGQFLNILRVAEKYA